MSGEYEKMDMRGFGWRVSISVLVSIGWLAFLVIWLFFYAGGYTIYQNLAVFLASILIVAAVMGASWASWGIRQKHGWECWEDAERRKAEKAEKKEARPPRKRRKKKR
jgi:type VI protein secretion system component VasK